MLRGQKMHEAKIQALFEVAHCLNDNSDESILRDLYTSVVKRLLGLEGVTCFGLFLKDLDWRCAVGIGGDGTRLATAALPARLRGLSTGIYPGLPEPFQQYQYTFPIIGDRDPVGQVLLGFDDMRGGIFDFSYLENLTRVFLRASENRKDRKEKELRGSYTKELEMAAEVQQHILPDKHPLGSWYRLHAVYSPYRIVGGDYFITLELDPHTLFVCVADVSGKGLPAALRMSSFDATLRTLLRMGDRGRNPDLGDLVSELNHAVCRQGRKENFISAFLGIFDRRQACFSFICCGHPPPVILSRGEVHELRRGPTLLGMFDHIDPGPLHTIHDLYDFLFFGYTDGLTEVFNGEDQQFGLHRIVDVLRKYHGDTAERVNAEVLRAMDGFKGPGSLHDDITMVSLKVGLGDKHQMDGGSRCLHPGLAMSTAQAGISVATSSSEGY